ncbi:hypothetical protein AA313_de0209775 [Arthrobotrys entomopaga]|nr:hypothetical protein AA313_de0209775 [Arthrobotrys entomopaga]
MPNRYRLRWNQIPPKLYRVDYPSSATEFDEDYGFIAGYQVSPYSGTPTISQFYKLVKLHLIWESTFMSRYISTFEDKKHALNWVETLRKRNPKMKGPIRLMTIQPTGREWVASVADILDDMLDIADHPEINPEFSEDEYIFFQEIPRHTIIKIEDV